MTPSKTVKHFFCIFQPDVILPSVVAPKPNVESNFRLFNLSSEGFFSFLHISLKSNKSFLLVNDGKQLQPSPIFVGREVFLKGKDQYG
jgi:hypothetical protein